MDPQAEKAPGLDLPKPSSERGHFTGSVSSAGGTHESLLPAIENNPAPAAAPPLTTPPPITPQPSVQGTVPASPQAPPVHTTPASGDDTSALDEEWINKAKAIVEQTKHDPRLESIELSKVKADYLRIRYNKHIKVVEEST